MLYVVGVDVLGDPFGYKVTFISKRTCRQRSQSELGKFAKGKRWTPVPTDE